MTDDRRKSDRLVVPMKPPNNAGRPAAEAGEGSERAKGNSPDGHDARTQRRTHAADGIERVRQVARRDRKQRFTALLHHVYDVERLRTAYLALKRDAAAGIDGETWRHYGEALETNLQDLSARITRGAFRANPVRRAYIDKTDGRKRPLGIPTLEDKIVQRAVAEVLGAIYEQDFLGFSYGFRPKRSPHQALDALTVGIETRRVNWVLDADIQGFFDTLNHEWLVRFLEHRVADRRVVRLIQKWLRAGVLEDGQRTRSEVGTVQGGSISPLLANVYLHSVFDLWVRPKPPPATCSRGHHASASRDLTLHPARASSNSAGGPESARPRLGNRRPSTSSASRTRAAGHGREGLRCSPDDAPWQASSRHRPFWRYLRSVVVGVVTAWWLLLAARPAVL